MRTVCYYPLMPAAHWQHVNLPEGATLLAYEAPSFSGKRSGRFWALVDTEAPTGVTRVAVLATGAEVPENASYVHTDAAEGLVWHLFVETPDHCW